MLERQQRCCLASRGFRRLEKHMKIELTAQQKNNQATFGAFGLSEPNVGSDAKSVETTARLRGDGYVLNGGKKWITYGQIADLFLVFAQCDGKISAFLVERNTPGLSTKPIKGMLGTRASM